MSREAGSIDLLSDGNAIFEVLGAWHLTAIRNRVSRRLGWSRTYAELIEREYRKFIFLCIRNPSTVYGMAGPVDEFWHEHLLDTANYFEMCRDVAGRFIHHFPSDNEETSGKSSSYERTLIDLARWFSEAPEEAWPKLDSEKCNGKCASCSNKGFDHASNH